MLKAGRDPLEVVVAVIRRKNLYLVAQRRAGDSFGGLWEFPGGKLHAGEALEEGLVREIQEELGIRIAVDAERMVLEHRYPERLIRLHCFDCRWVEGEPRAIECAAWRWVRVEELEGLKFPPASGPLIQVIAGRSNPGDCFGRSAPSQ